MKCIGFPRRHSAVFLIERLAEGYRRRWLASERLRRPDSWMTQDRDS